MVCATLALASCGGGGAEQKNANASAAGTPGPTPPGAAATPPPQAQVVTATVEEARLAAGGAGEASVRLDIAQGYHVNANPASDKFLVPTELRAAPQEGVTPGKPVYPRGVMRKLGFSDKPLSLYEGSVVVKLPLRADRNLPPGRRTLRAKLRVQPCTDVACDPPREIDAPIPVTVN